MGLYCPKSILRTQPLGSVEIQPQLMCGALLMVWFFPKPSFASLSSESVMKVSANVAHHWWYSSIIAPYLSKRSVSKQDFKDGTVYGRFHGQFRWWIPALWGGFVHLPNASILNLDFLGLKIPYTWDCKPFLRFSSSVLWSHNELRYLQTEQRQPKFCWQRIHLPPNLDVHVSELPKLLAVYAMTKSYPSLLRITLMAWYCGSLSRLLNLGVIQMVTIALEQNHICFRHQSINSRLSAVLIAFCCRALPRNEKLLSMDFVRVCSSSQVK